MFYTNTLLSFFLQSVNVIYKRYFMTQNERALLLARIFFCSVIVITWKF